METHYTPEDLAKFPEIGKEAPDLANKFFEYYEAVFSEGELTEREKALIALAVAHAVQCPYCIDAYVQACLKKGSNKAEMTEAVHVAAAIRGGRFPGSRHSNAKPCGKDVHVIRIPNPAKPEPNSGIEELNKPELRDCELKNEELNEGSNHG